MHRRVLIPNRGVIARRIVRACRKLGVQSVVCHSDLDAQTPAVEEADEAVRLPGYRAKDTYLNSHLILEIAKKFRADADSSRLWFSGRIKFIRKRRRSCRNDFCWSFLRLDRTNERQDRSTVVYAEAGHSRS